MIVEAPLYLALALPLLLYLPGWALHRRLGAPADLLEAAFERVAASALWSGWLALLLAELGLFSLWLHLLITLAASALLALRSPVSRSPVSALPVSRSPVSRSPGLPVSRSLVEQMAHAAVLLVALLLVARPFETVLGVRDAGVYANAGFAIARTGGLVQGDPLLAQWGQEAEDSDEAVAGPASQAISNYTIGQPRDRYIATRLRSAGFFVYEGDLPAGRVVPQGLHLLPAWIALLTAIGGPYLGLFAPGLLSVLAVWSVGMLGRRLAGPWVGVLAMAFLALNGTQIWFGRYSTAETAAQLLIFAGLYFFAGMFDEGRRTKDGGRRTRARRAPLPDLRHWSFVVGLAVVGLAVVGPLSTCPACSRGSRSARSPWRGSTSSCWARCWPTCSTSGSPGAGTGATALWPSASGRCCSTRGCTSP